MKRRVVATGIARGYAKDEKDSDRLKKAGVRTIYRLDKGEALGKFKMRDGENLGVVDGLRIFGERRSQIASAIKLIHSWGATVVDAESRENSRDHGIQMLDDALKPRRPTGYMAELQERSVKSRLKDGRSPKREALAAWRNPRLKLKEVLEVTNWPQSTLYNTFGPRFKVKMD